MQVHGPSGTFERATVKLNNVDPSDPFVTVDHGTVRVNAETVAECDVMIAAWTEARRLLAGAQTDHAIAADLAGQTATRVPLDVVGDEPEADPVPWPTGLCGHPVPPGAWAAGFSMCRDCVAARAPGVLPRYDEAAAPDLTVVDDEDGPQ